MARRAMLKAFHLLMVRLSDCLSVQRMQVEVSFLLIMSLASSEVLKAS
jgi:hypothetical protein